MSLLSDAMQDCVFMDRNTRTPDGYGGYTTTYTEGAPFKAAIYLSQSVETKVAEQQGVKGLYQVTTGRDVRLEYHDVFKRLADAENGVEELVLRVTSKDENATPKSTTLDMRVISAEEWSLSDG